LPAEQSQFDKKIKCKALDTKYLFNKLRKNNEKVIDVLKYLSHVYQKGRK